MSLVGQTVTSLPAFSTLYGTENGLLTRAQVSAKSRDWGGWLGWKSSGATPAGLWAGPVLVGPLNVVKSSPEKLSFLWSPLASRGNFGLVVGREGPFSLWLNQTSTVAELGGQAVWQGPWGGLGASFRRQVSLCESWEGFLDGVRWGGRWRTNPWELLVESDAQWQNHVTEISGGVELRYRGRTWSTKLGGTWSQDFSDESLKDKVFGEITWRKGTWNLKTAGEISTQATSIVFSRKAFLNTQVLWKGVLWELWGEARAQWQETTGVPEKWSDFWLQNGFVQPVIGFLWRGRFSPSLEIEGADLRQSWAVCGTLKVPLELQAPGGQASVLFLKAGLTSRPHRDLYDQNSYELSVESLWVAGPLRVRLILDRRKEGLGPLPLEVWGPTSQISLTVYWDF